MLELNFFMLIITVVVFSYLVKYLNKHLYSPLLSLVDDREIGLAKDEKKISENNSDTEKLTTQIHNIIAQARQEAANIKNEANKEARTKAEVELLEKRLEFDSDFESFMATLEVKKEELKKELSKNLPSFQNDLKATIAKI